MAEPLQILHRLVFARGSEALDFVRTLRELGGRPLGGDAFGAGPIVVYGARIVSPDAPSELYVSIGALALAHAVGMEAAARRSSARADANAELPADMALLFTAASSSDELASGP